MSGKQYFNISKAWLTVAMLFIVAALNYLDRTMISTMRESIVNDVHITDAQFGLLTSVFLWIYGIFSPFAGFIADRFKKHYVIIGSLLVWSGVTWLTGHAHTFEELLATRALMGISEAFYMPAALALIVDYHPGKTQSSAVGIHLAGTTVGQSLGFLGGMIAEMFTWRHAFNYFGIIGVVYAFLLFFFLKQPQKAGIQQDYSSEKAGRIHFGTALKDIFNKRSFWYLLLFWCMLGIVGWLVVGWLPTYYMDRFNLTQGVAGLYATAYLYPASILGLITGGLFSDRWSKSYRYARMLVPIVGLAIAAPSIFAASYVALIIPAIVFFMCYAFTKMFVDSNLMSILCMLVDERYRATGYGILNMLATIVGGIGIFAAGALRDRDIDLGIVYQSAAVCLAICIILMYRVYKKEKKKNETK
jgi:predicted MFS family arabinose efflux permease